MKRLLSTTTALSLVLAPLPTLPLFAQSLAEDGSLLSADGAVLCGPGDAVPCDLDSILATLAERGQTEVSPEVLEALTVALAARAEANAAAAEAEAQKAAEAAAVEEEAQKAAQAAAEEEARKAAEAAEAEAQRAAEAEAAAAQEAERLRAEEEAAEAARQAEAAEAEADAQKAAEAEAAAAAEAQRAADEETARLEAELKRAEEEAAAAAAATAPAEAAPLAEAPAEQAPVVEAPVEEAPAEEAPVAEAPTQEAPVAEAPVTEAPSADGATVEAVPETAPEVAAEVAPEAPAEAEAEAEVIPLEDLPEDTQAAFEAATAAEAAAEAAAAEAPEAQAEATPVDIPEVSAEEVQTLSDLLTGDPEAATAAVGAAAAAALGLGDTPTSTSEPPATSETVATDAIAPTADAPAQVNVTTITEDDTRSSFEEFAEAPTVLEDGKKKSGLSDLEKAGLLALGAIVVGNLLSDGREVVANTGDRVVVRQPDGEFQVYKDDDTLLRRPGSTVRTETYKDGSTRTLVEREDGTQVVTIRDATGRVLRRAVYDLRGNETLLIDDLAPEERIDVSVLPEPRPARLTISANGEDAALRAELARIEAQRIGRTFSLRQIREVPQVRKLAAVIDVDNITFDSGSAVIRTTEARKLAAIGRTMGQLLDENPNEVFLIEGHTDAVGSASSNLTLSDRRAESVALALTEYFGIPPENLVVQGYGEYDLRIDTLADERLNRRAAVRVVTPLMRTADLR
jgi:outer membrane protein OmpA-like peptidoglycan-associated protein